MQFTSQQLLNELEDRKRNPHIEKFREEIIAHLKEMRAPIAVTHDYLRWATSQPPLANERIHQIGLGELQLRPLRDACDHFLNMGGKYNPSDVPR